MSNILENTTTDEEPDHVSDQFQGILTSLTTFKSQITSLQQQLRGLEKTIQRELKASRKAEAKKRERKVRRKASGFAKPTEISTELLNFMSKSEGEKVARTEVTKFIIDYIKEKGLQKPENRKIILPDQVLTELLDVKETEEVTYFNLQRYMNRHFLKKKE